MINPEYLSFLSNQGERIQRRTDLLIEKYKAQVVGNGYIDIILGVNDAISFTKEVTALPIAIERLTWWCLCTEESQLKFSCPHGMGGPQNRFGGGYFSECVQFPSYENISESIKVEYSDPFIFSKTANEQVLEYLVSEYRKEFFYSPCLHIGLWLYVPDKWIRVR